MNEIATSLARIADRLTAEIKTATDMATVSRLLDLHADAVRYVQMIESGIDVSIDAVEDFLRRASA